jgi:hypothetical protein
VHRVAQYLHNCVAHASEVAAAPIICTQLELSALEAHKPGYLSTPGYTIDGAVALEELSSRQNGRRLRHQGKPKWQHHHHRDYSTRLLCRPFDDTFDTVRAGVFRPGDPC